MQQPVAHEQRDAPDTCWNFDDDDGDRLAETLLILPGAFSGPVRFGRAIGAGWNGLGTSQVRGQAFDISRGGNWSRSRQAQVSFLRVQTNAMQFSRKWRARSKAGLEPGRTDAIGVQPIARRFRRYGVEAAVRKKA